ncbi:acyl-homoserine-lactone synthase [soil metagenome]
MIRIIENNNRREFAKSLEQQFRLRHDVFVNELRWRDSDDRQVEIDQYDDEHATYITSVDSHDDVVGCFRLYPTTRPYMLSETFRTLVDGPMPQSLEVFEVTRFAIAKDHRRGRTYQELFLGMIEHSLSRGIVGNVAVMRTMKIPVQLELGISVRPLGLSQPIGDENNTAVYWAMSEEVLDRVRRIAGVVGTVLENADSALHRVA